jgi:peptide/nickel transport system substrate-binding protein
MNRFAVSRAAAAVIIIVIITVGGAGAYTLFSKSQPATPVSTTSVSIPYNQTLIVDVTSGEPTWGGIDPSWSVETTAYQVEQNLYQGLVWYNGSSSTEFVGALATSWKISPDGKTYTFNLRPNVQFSNGRPFNAYAAWFNYYRLTLNNGPPSYILGAATFNPGPVTLDDLNSFDFQNPTPSQLNVMQDPNQSIQVLDENTIAFHLAQPMSSFLARLTSPCGGIIDPTFVQENGGVKGNSTANDYIIANGGPGTGPYMIGSWVRGQSLTLVLNPHYWGPQPHASRIILQWKTNVQDAINDLKTGAAQAVYSVPFNLIPTVENTPGIILDNQSLTWNIDFMPINTQAYPLNNLDVRLAINYAIDKNAIIDKILNGYGATYQGPIPSGMYGYDNSISPIGYDLAKAKALLAQAGFPNGQGIRPLTLAYELNDPLIQAAVQAIQSDLARVGITVNLKGMVPNTFWSILPTTFPVPSDYPDMLYKWWSPDFGHPDDYTILDSITSGWDWQYLNDTQLTQWIDEAAVNPSPTAQLHLYSEITQRDKDLSSVVWLFQRRGITGVRAWSSTVENVTGNPNLYGFDYSTLYIQPSAVGGIIEAQFMVSPTRVKVVIPQKD